MSTRCNVVIRDSDTALIFYRHTDGYPSRVVPILEKFLKTPNLKKTAIQSSGWLVVMGRDEMLEDNAYFQSRHGSIPGGWEGKVGYFEPTCSIQPDIDYIYIVDMVDSTISAYEADPDIDSWEQYYLERTKLEVSSK